MTHLDAFLGTLLLRNNCVVIPAFGGFVANNVSAKVDVKNGLITPPSKALSFNKNLSNNDGLIINHLATKKKISFDEAQEIISHEVQQIKSQLKAGKRIHFNNVGFLYTNSAGKIAFEQDRFFNLLLSSYGLGNVQFISEEEETLESVKETKSEVEIEKTPIPSESVTTSTEKVDDNTTTKEKEKDKEQGEKEKSTIPHPAATKKSSNSLLKKVVKYAAVAALVPLAFYSFWIPMRTDVLKSGVIYKEDFNPFKSTEVINYQPAIREKVLTIDTVQPSTTLTDITENLNSETPVFAYPLTDDLFIPVRRKVEKSNKEDNATDHISEKKVIPAKNSYHAIVGCFGNPSNATDLIAELKAKGFDAYKVDVKGGLHRVSAGNTTKRSEISSLRKKIAPTDLPVWILKK